MKTNVEDLKTQDQTHFHAQHLLDAGCQILAYHNLRDQPLCNSTRTSILQKQTLLIQNAPEDTIIPVDDKLAITTHLPEFLALGDITLRLQGEFYKDMLSRKWVFRGQLKSFDDVYDFNPSTHRDPSAEAATRAGSFFPGKEYKVEIRGSRDIHESGSYR